MGCLSVTIVAMAAGLLGQAANSNLIEIGRLSNPAIKEASALEASLRYPGVYWTVSDSGNPANLYAIDGQGKLLAIYSVTGAVNFDWECLALDRSGRLYICDVGNNLIQEKSRFPQRWVYVVQEPDPREAADGRADRPRELALERTILVRYPGPSFDIEAAFACDDALYFVSKQSNQGSIYRLSAPEARRAADPETPTTLEKVIDLPGLDRATSAALSPDGRRLAVCTYEEVCIYNVAEAASFALADVRPAKRIRFRAPTVEACSWDGPNVLLLNELGVLYRLSAR